MEHDEDTGSMPSTPVTPGTPGAPLFGGFRPDRHRYFSRPRSLLKSCKCFSVEPWELEDGTLPPVSCALPPPSVSLVQKVPLYIGAQVMASLCASFLLKAIFHPVMNGGVTIPSVEYGYGQAFALEFIISFNLMFVVTAVATDTKAELLNRGWSYCYAQHTHSRAINWSFNEPCKDSRTCSSCKQLQSHMGVPHSSDLGNSSWSRCVFCGQAAR
ncbi:hypothetical protein Leryth_003035 [Lithospermum erythrorhizon]|nr:hypothetical protein Leryth_003035 [Lithospermum erythrorhizon]